MLGEKFDIYRFLYENALNELSDEEVDPQTGAPMGAPPNQQGQPPAPAPDPQAAAPAQTEPEATPAQQATPQTPSKLAFAGMVGETVKGMEFQPTPNGGSVVIQTDSSLPFIISWEGDSVTVKHKGITKLR